MVNSFIARVIFKIRNWKNTILAEYIINKYKLPSSTKIVNGRLNLIGANFKCGENCAFYGDVTINAGDRIEIGRYTSISGPNTDIINALNPIKIGSFCSIARNVSIQEFNHNLYNFTSYFIEKHMMGKSSHQEKYSKGEIIIGDDVWIGTHSVILSGANIGTGAVIAANSIVVGDIPPYAIVGGSPAKVIKYRFSKEKIKKLLESDWPSRIDKSNYDQISSELNE